MINEYKESTGYRRVFECAKNEGIEETLNLFRQIEELQKIDLIKWAILGNTHYTLSLTRKNKNVINYLREYKNVLQTIVFSNKDLMKSLEIAKDNPKILETYIKNMKMLEELKIDKIRVVELKEILNPSYYLINIEKNNGMIDRINKYYTDGNVDLLEKMLNIDENTSRILIKITNPINHERNTTFLLTVNNDRKYKQFESRTIQITGFDFNSEYLPTEDELSSYEIPSTLKLNK